MQFNIGYLIKKHALLHPEKTAVIFEDSPISYKKLNNEINRCAHYLQSLGLKKGDRVAVLLLNSPKFIHFYYASAKLGLILVPLNFRLVGPELAYQLKNSGARLLAFHDMFQANVEPIRDEVPVDKDKFVFLKSMMGQGNMACPDWAVDYEDTISGFPVDEPEPEKPVDIEDPLAIIYTSGVTGAPKGAMVNHSQTFFKIMNTSLGLEQGLDDVMLAQLPLFHSGGLFISLTPALSRGATSIVREGFDPEQFALDIEKYRATVVFALTTMWRFILQTGKLDEIDTSIVKHVFGGGERTPVSMIEELAKRGLYMQQGFGMTENSAMMNQSKEDVLSKQGSVGRPGWCSEIWIEGPDGEKLGAGEIGEIVAAGPMVMSEYWNMPEKTAEALRDGALHTGDLGYTDEEGYFYIVDRAKDMYRSGGENVYPAEVEKILYAHPKIQNIAIIGTPDDKWGETGMAIIQCESGETITKDDVHEFLKGKVARFKYPSRIKLIESLPMTATGKIKKADLKKEYGS